MAAGRTVTALACTRAYWRVVELGRDVPPGTPAAGFLAAAAATVDRASAALSAAHPDSAHAGVLLADATGLLADVAAMGSAGEAERVSRLRRLLWSLLRAIDLG